MSYLMVSVPTLPLSSPFSTLKPDWSFRNHNFGRVLPSLTSFMMFSSSLEWCISPLTWPVSISTIRPMSTAPFFHNLLPVVNSSHYEFLSRTRGSSIPTQLSAFHMVSLHLKYTVFYFVHLNSSYTSIQLRLEYIPFERIFVYPKADEIPLPNHPVPNSTLLT